jgi:UDP-N-acetylglucosamine 2-epimerase (non-hydrolysing)
LLAIEGDFRLMHITCVAGARPNFVKIAPILSAAARRPREIQTRLVHTGQHYDTKMSGLFFDELGIRPPDVDLGVGSGSHAVQTASVMVAFDGVLDAGSTDLVLVVGDVNSTLACALVAQKRGVAVAHVEAGLRSGDRTMPEEINRMLTDQISDFLFTTERSALKNLVREGIDPFKVFFVGNVMIDTLVAQRERARHRGTPGRLGLQPDSYGLCTLHRPSNVDTEVAARNSVAALKTVAKRLPVVFPLHPRTRARLEEYGLLAALRTDPSILLMDPLGYLDFLCLMDHARVILTDSGGIQEESTVLGTPCLAFRLNTERPITMIEGTNQLVGLEPSAVGAAIDDILARDPVSPRIPELWDGRAADRILDVLVRSGRGIALTAQAGASTRSTHAERGKTTERA